MNNRSRVGLKKRTKIDMICTIIVAVIAIGMAFTQFSAYVSTNGTNPDYLTNGIYDMFVFGIALILGIILREVHRIGKPFSKRIIIELRILALYVIIGGMLTSISVWIIDDMVNISNFFNGTSDQISIDFAFSLKYFIVPIIGVLIGVISEIFVYGYDLQNDVDSIA